MPATARSQQPSTPKSSLGGRKEAAEKKEETKSRKTPSPAVSQVPLKSPAGRLSLVSPLKMTLFRTWEKQQEEVKPPVDNPHLIS